MALDPARALEIKGKMLEVETAIHQLMTGTAQVKVVQRGDRRIEYARGNLSDLRAYLAYLQKELDRAEGTTGSAIGVHFG